MRRVLCMIGISSALSWTSAKADPNFPMPETLIPSVIHLNTGATVIPPGARVWWPWQDALNSPAQPWHWETEQYIPPNEPPRQFYCRWVMPQGDVLASLSINPGGSVYTHIEIDDSMLIPPETNFYFASYLNAQQFTVVEHMTIIEGPSHMPGFQFLTHNANFVTIASIPDNEPYVEFSIIPEPSSLGLAGLFACTMLHRRRRLG